MWGNGTRPLRAMPLWHAPWGGGGATAHGVSPPSRGVLRGRGLHSSASAPDPCGRAGPVGGGGGAPIPLSLDIYCVDP